MELKRNPGKKWGFKDNPFDTKALSAYSEFLPISKAFVGRSMDSPESRHLLNIVQNPSGGRAIVEGDILSPLLKKCRIKKRDKKSYSCF